MSQKNYLLKKNAILVFCKYCRVKYFLNNETEKTHKNCEKIYNEELRELNRRRGFGFREAFFCSNCGRATTKFETTKRKVCFLCYLKLEGKNE